MLPRTPSWAVAGSFGAAATMARQVSTEQKLKQAPTCAVLASDEAYNTAYALDIETWEWRALRNGQGPWIFAPDLS